jgi:DUF1016 N-terminal domain
VTWSAEATEKLLFASSACLGSSDENAVPMNSLTRMADLRQAFPSMSGFSPRNVWDMKRFYLAYSDEAIWRQPVAKSTKGRKAPPFWPPAVAKLKDPDDPTVILRQPVAEFEEEGVWLQPVAKLNRDTVIPFLRQLVAEIPWGQNLLILNKLTNPALRTKANPIGVAAYELQSKLPGELKGKLPTAKQLAGIVRAEMEEGK